MNEQQINEAKIIALWMGVTYWQAWRRGGYEPLFCNKYASQEACQQGIDVYFGPGNHDCVPKLCFPTEYHTDWNWLMSVWHKFMTMRPEGDSGFFYDGFCVKISQCILQDPTPSAAASLLAQAITWIESLKK